ncbi:MAG: HAMP domain-containing histidine kinase [Bacilli bacterium]|jgi:signal transduction histidine kinase|nr:HAMP domain-containing histidine kinase [Bacilli bacterium]
MKARDFIKDKFIAILFVCILYGMILFLLKGFQVNPSLVIAITILYWGMMFALAGYEYYRKKSFYELLQTQLTELDQTYLLHTMLYLPNFYDGRVLYQALYEGNKAMKEQINIYRDSMEDFKEYVELWIHEIKIPLASGLLILHNHALPEGQKLAENFHKMDDYLEQILYYVRSENPEKDYFIKQLNLKNVVNKVAVKNKDSFIYRKIKLELEEVDEMVYSDSKWLEFIINQIVQNSIKYGKQEGAVIRITTSKNQGIVTLFIHDNGIGIEQSDINRVFEKGFTGQNGRKIAHSTGMGLYLCHRLCEKLGHHLAITSTLGEGTTIKITFPQNAYYDVLNR